jgi:L-aminopeptidase/D-esterase-like protein
MVLSPSKNSITEVPGITVGHAQNDAARTGCTVILCGADGAVAGVDVRGAAPGTRETDLLEPGSLVDRVHAVVLTGGSVFGLDSACGVARFLEERGIGYKTGTVRVPIVPAAVIYDLAVASPGIRPDSRMGYEACLRASESAAEGRIGAGAGATVGKILGHDYSSRGGIGSASARVRGGATVGALVVVNAFGDIVDPVSGKILAGARDPAGSGWLDTSRELIAPEASGDYGGPSLAIQNTTLAVIATDALLTNPQVKRVASMAHDGLARAIRPVHTMFDGDTIFALSTGTVKADVTTIGAAAADILAQAIVRAALAASPM